MHSPPPELDARTPALSALRTMVIVPCFNEMERLHPGAFKLFFEQEQHVEFLFVNDGSTDGTLALLHSLQKEHPDHIHVLDKQPNAGKADAVRVGMLHALQHGDVAVTGFWDADLATPLSAISHFLRVMLQQPSLEMIFGSRVRLLGHSIHRRPVRHYLGRCFATAVSLLLRMPVYDTQCGAKLFRVTPDLRMVLATPFKSRWIFDVEIIARFITMRGNDQSRVSCVMYESPLPCWKDVAGSKVGPLDFLMAFRDLLKIQRARKHNSGHGLA